MSIRPKFHIIFGIDDLQTNDHKITDPRYTEKGYCTDDEFRENALPNIIKYVSDMNLLHLVNNQRREGLLQG